jgi:hypothetical protein
MSESNSDSIMFSSKELAVAIAQADFSGYAATVIGYGNMGRQYVQALQCLGVAQIRVCSRSEAPLEPLKQVPGLTAKSGGYELLDWAPEPGELAIIATSISELVPAAHHLADLGFLNILIEKPVSLDATEIQELAQDFVDQKVYGVCGYNRVAYPSLIELAARAEDEGGITSCKYTITEIIREDWTERFSAEELARWGIANSMHVISMAHGLIGPPKNWTSHRTGSISWHPTGSVFVGSGISDGDVPFAYHGDWGSKGRWSVEAHTAVAAYRLCPLEKLFRRESAMGEWEEVPVTSFAPQVKAGILEEVAAMLTPAIKRGIPQVSIKESEILTRYAESVFGYSSN